MSPKRPHELTTPPLAYAYNVWKVYALMFGVRPAQASPSLGILDA